MKELADFLSQLQSHHIVSKPWLCPVTVRIGMLIEMGGGECVKVKRAVQRF